MAVRTSSIAEMRQMFRTGEVTPPQALDDALANANSNVGHNVYLSQNHGWSREQGEKLRREDAKNQPLWGVPVSLKDCFDLAGFATSCGSMFCREHLGIASVDSTVAAKLRSAGAVITGKTHLHQLAYGITGENRDYGDCAQPRDKAVLTGGSSSGAAASVQEGSAMAAIGTDTGGSIRVPAALCGVAGYRSSVTLNPESIWRGGFHLAGSFDTIGWLYGDLGDGPLLGHALLDLPIVAAPDSRTLRFGIPDENFLTDCDGDVRATLRSWEETVRPFCGSAKSFDAQFWNEALPIYAPIQASEAAALHAGYFHHFEPAIAERLAWGASIDAAELSELHQRKKVFEVSMSALFDTFDYLLVPCSPMSSIAVGANHHATRSRILRYTTPISVAGLPVVTLPKFQNGSPAGGIQLVGRMGSDASLLAVSALLSKKRENDATLHP